VCCRLWDSRQRLFKTFVILVNFFVVVLHTLVFLRHSVDRFAPRDPMDDVAQCIR
jgi:hypothetical protein